MEPEESRKIALVVADNQETVLRSVSATLERAGFDVFATSSGSEALLYCRESSRPIQLAVIDSEAVGINAPEFARNLNSVSPATRTLLLTGDDGEDTLHDKAGSSRNFGVLRKPFRRSQLLGHVLEIMDRPKFLTA